MGGGAGFFFHHSNTCTGMPLPVLIGRGRTNDAAAHDDEVKCVIH
jgi:hypothetical protein